MVDRANLCSSFRPIAHFAVELELCDCATPSNNRELRSKGVAMHTWRFRILRVYQKSIKWTWVELFETNIKIERGSSVDLDNESLL